MTIDFTKLDAAVADLKVQAGATAPPVVTPPPAANPFGLSTSTLALVLASGTAPLSNPTLAIAAGSKPSFYLLLKMTGIDTDWGNVVMLGNNEVRVYSRGTDPNGTLLQDGVSSKYLPVDGQPHLLEFVQRTPVAALTGLRFVGDGGWTPASRVIVAGYVITRDVLSDAQAAEVRTKLAAVGGVVVDPPPPVVVPPPVVTPPPVVVPPPVITPPPPIVDGDPRFGRTQAFEENFTVMNFGTQGLPGPAGAQFWAGTKPSMFDSGQFGWFKLATNVAGEFGHAPFSIVDDPAAADGKALQIQAKWVGSAANIYTTEPKYQWVSGLLASANLNRGNGTFTNFIGFDGGYFFCRMKVPSSPYTWPAFWLINRDGALPPYANSAELDVIEHKGFERFNYGAYYHQWTNTSGGLSHVGLGPHLSASGGPRSYPSADDVDLTQGYHDYGLLLENGRISFYIDHLPIKDTSGQIVSFPFLDPNMATRGDKFFIVLNLAGFGEIPDPWPMPTVAQQTINLLVDHIKVWT